MCINLVEQSKSRTVKKSKVSIIKSSNQQFIKSTIHQNHRHINATIYSTNCLPIVVSFGMDISLVIPVYNEQDKVLRDIHEAISFFKKHSLKGEVIVVDDGSVDATSERVRDAMSRHEASIRLISSKPNRGKGYAVRQGVLMAAGLVVLFADSGYCIPFEDALPAIRLIRDDKADMATGSRFLKDSKIFHVRPWYRRLISWLFRKCIRFYAGLPFSVTDSQCGFKLYSREAGRALFGPCQTEGFLFDVEVILRAERAGCRLIEFPVHWTPDADSRLSVSRHFFAILRELRAVKRLFA